MPRFTLIAVLSAAVLLSPGMAAGACSKGQGESTPRFALRNGEVLDQKTNLVWDRCSVGTSWNGSRCVGTVKLMSFAEAEKVAAKRGGGWRIPTIDELFSIVERNCSNPAINSQVFPGLKSFAEGAPYWSSTRDRQMKSMIYFVDFLSGEADAHAKGFPLALRLVRNDQ